MLRIRCGRHGRARPASFQRSDPKIVAHDDESETGTTPPSPPALPSVEQVSVTPLPDLLGLGQEEPLSDPGAPLIGAPLRGRSNTEELD
ncbi:MAG: hypothetical protein RBU30_27745, partial [Polyangia bacterium]|nr:hypothetical protein [Polyangia bacterium]